jgi:hypothetical protein
MYYKPSEDEKNMAAFIQIVAVVAFFLPGLVMGMTRGGRSSPYLRYWSKASRAWSVCAIVLIVISFAVRWYYQTDLLLLLTCLIHLLFCVMGALAAEAELPFRYLFVGDVFCRDEMAVLWFDPDTYAETQDDEEGMDGDRPL